MQHIFISYSHKDQEFVQGLVDELHRRNFRVWMDKRGIDPGSDWQQAIKQAIKQSAVVVVILSPAAVGSPWVNIEVNAALDANITVIPYILEECPFPAWLEDNHIQAIFHKDAGALEALTDHLPRTAHIYESSIVEGKLLGRSKVTFAQAAEKVEDILQFDCLGIELIGLPLKATQYCTTYLVGRAADSLAWQPQVQIGLQLDQVFPGDSFPLDIAAHFLKKDPSFNLRLLLVRGPYRVSLSDDDKSRLQFNLDAERPAEWEDVLQAVQMCLDIYEAGAQKPALQFFALGPVVMLYRLGVLHKGFYKTTLYHYDRYKQHYFPVL